MDAATVADGIGLFCWRSMMLYAGWIFLGVLWIVVKAPWDNRRQKKETAKYAIEYAARKAQSDRKWALAIEHARKQAASDALSKV